MRALALFFASGLITPCFAGTLFYGGDLNDNEAIINFYGDGLGDARVYEDFIYDGQMPTTAWANLTSSFSPTQVLIEIRSGMAAGNGGSVLYSGISNATATILPGGTSTGPNMRVQGDILLPVSLTLSETYWFSVVPILLDANSSCALWATDGVNGVGSTVGNGQAFFFNANNNYTPASSLVNNPNFSMGIASVPEPLSLLSLAAGIGVLLRRRK